MEMNDFIIMIILLSMVSVGTGYIVGSFNTVYGGAANISKFNNTFNQFNEGMSFYNSTRDTALTSGSLDESVGLVSFSKNIFAAIKNLINAPMIIYNMISDTMVSFGLGWIMTPLLILMSVTLLFMIIYFVYRWRG